MIESEFLFFTSFIISSIILLKFAVGLLLLCARSSVRESVSVE